jgi:hypothetical protein
MAASDNVGVGKVLPLLINGDTRDLELGELKVVRVRDCLRTRPRASRRAVRGASPVAAEGNIEDDLMRLKVLSDIALIGAEECYRCGPCRRVWLARLDVRGHVSARELPDGDPGAVHPVRNDTPSLLIEVGPERVRLRDDNATARIVHAARCARPACNLPSERRARWIEIRSRPKGNRARVPHTARAGVKCDVIVLALVNRLEEVHFACVRPARGGAERPVRRPRSASMWRGPKVGNEEASIPRRFG